ncbi:extracellular solute-binding protein [Paenibacillus cymbidii]|uniref:extracellular solute-binding protein n=1 Tax=Paenibacillus cymbidii TaxID=1639034 RepID=UPI0014367D90|nr:extracellular solute-binding protein [Paenibacillus cymbidii]
MLRKAATGQKKGKQYDNDKDEVTASMKKHVWTTAVLTTALAATVITGCESRSTTEKPAETTKAEQKKTPDNLNLSGFPVVSSPITLTLMGSKTANQLAWNDMVFFQEMEKLTNIKFTFDTPAAESYKEKLNLRFASGNLPDVLFGANLQPADEIMFGGQGQLIPLEKLIADYAPNIRKLLDDNPDIRRNITTPDGHIYSLPFIDTPDAFGVYPKLWINESWLKALNLQMPKTVDELIAVLRAFKNNDPNKNGKQDEIPMSFNLAAAGGVPDIQNVLLNAFGFTGPMSVDKDNVRFAPAAPEYKAYLSFMNQLYTEGLLDKEGYSQTVQQKNAKGNAGRIGVFAAGGPFQVVGNDQDKNYSILPPLTSQVNATPFSVRANNLTKGTFAITKSNKSPEATIRWVDYLYSAEGALLAAQGIEGKHYEYVDNKQGLKALVPAGANPAEFRGTISPNAGTLIPRIHEPVQKLNNYNLKETNPLNYHIEQETNSKLRPVARNSFPLIYFSMDQQQQLKVLETDITTYVNEMSGKFTVGDVALDSKWNEYTATLDKMNVKQYVSIYQQAYNQWAGKK